MELRDVGTINNQAGATFTIDDGADTDMQGGSVINNHGVMIHAGAGTQMTIRQREITGPGGVFINWTS